MGSGRPLEAESKSQPLECNSFSPSRPNLIPHPYGGIPIITISHLVSFLI